MFDKHQEKSGYIDIQNGKLFYQRFGTGDPIIIVHGGPGLYQGYLLPQMLELAKDHELIFYDQRGTGGSLEANIDPKYVTVDQFTEDLEILRSALGLEKIRLIGHSWGGFISMNYAIKYHKNISALILINSIPADYEGKKSFIEELNKRTQPIQQKIAALFDYEMLNKLNKSEINESYRNLFSVYFKDSANVEKLTLDMSKESAINGFNILSLMLKTSYFTPECNLMPGLRNLNIPTFIIHGNQDVIPVVNSKNIQNAVPGAEALYLDNCGHFPYIEKPNELFSSIKLFLSKK